MVYRVELLEGGAIEIELKSKMISKATYIGKQFGERTTVLSYDEKTIEYWMDIILKNGLKEFKMLLDQIREDETYFSYGKNLLEAEKERKTQRMLKYQRECVEKIKRMQEEINEFTFT